MRKLVGVVAPYKLLKQWSKQRRRIKTEENVKVVAVGWGMYLNATLTI